MQTSDINHLFCLALARRDHDGTQIKPGQRNEYKFHFRHFTSNDHGASWTDKGVALKPGNIADKNDAGNIWSGGVIPLEDGRILHGFTGIADNSKDHPFIQSVNFALGTKDGPVSFADSAASHPVRDRKHITDVGYYLPSEDIIGHKDGDEDGPITAWRDPYFFKTETGDIFAFWSAKISPRVPAVAWGKISIQGDKVSLDLLPPITLPDSNEYTQAEVPKVCKNSVTGTYYMMISSCDRLNEKQPDSDVSKQLRIYKSDALNGPWKPYREHSNVLQNEEFLFGASFIDMHPSNETVSIIAPITEKASRKLELTFAPVKSIAL